DAVGRGPNPIFELRSAALADDNRALGQKLFGDADRLIQNAARVAAKVEYQTVQLRSFQSFKGAFELVSRRVIKALGHIDIADVAVQNKCILDRRLRHN